MDSVHEEMIERFKEQVRTRGMARTNRYRVRIPFPTTDASGVELAELFCENVTLPGTNISTVSQRFYGEKREIPYEKGYDTVQMSFYVDAAMTVKTAFDRWINLIVNPERRTLGYYNNYVRDIEIFVDTVDGQTPYLLKLYEAYPKSIGTIQMGYESRDIMKLPVNIEYRYWRAWSSSLQGASRSGPNLPNIPQDPINVATGTGIPGTLQDIQQFRELLSFPLR